MFEERGETPTVEVRVFRHGELIHTALCESEEQASLVVDEWAELEGVECEVEDLSVHHRPGDVLEPEPRAFLSSLEPQAVEDGIGLYHASPRDPVWEYVLSPDAALGAFTAVGWPLLLVGHSHVALSLALTPAGVEGGISPAGAEVDLSKHERWLLNPGSVGQPRDGDPRAAYLLVDLEALRAVFRRVAYPVEQTQAEMRERRLPEALIARLSHGV